jgi:hypothetical protein
MATVTPSLPLSSNQNKRFLWFYQSNSNPYNKNKKEDWKRYSDFQNQHIEEAFQRKENYVQLDDYVINFDHKVQFKKDGQNSQRPVKREEVDLRLYVRKERFSYPERAIRSFDNDCQFEMDFAGRWEINHKSIVNAANFRDIAEWAAKGKY